MNTEDLREELRKHTVTFTRRQIKDNHESTLAHNMKLYVMEDRPYRALPLDQWEKVIKWWSEQKQPHTLEEEGLWCWGKAMGLAALSRWYLDIDGVGMASDFSSKHGYAVPLIVNDDKTTFRYGISEPWAVWEIKDAYEHHFYKMEKGIIIF